MRRMIVKRKIFVIVMLSTLVLSGCQETPEKVKDNMKEYGENKQLEDSEIIYCDVSELKDINSYNISGNITYEGNIDFSKIKDVSVLNLAIEEDYLNDKNKDKYTTLFNVDNSIYEEMDAGNSDLGKSISYESDNKYLNIMENGGMAHMSRRVYDSADNTVIEKYNIDKDDVTDVTVQIEGGEVNIAEVCNKVENWLDQNMTVEGIDYKISNVNVRELDDNNDVKWLAMCAEYEYEGIRLNNYTGLMVTENDDYTTDKLATNAATLIEYDGIDDVPCYFSRNYHFKLESAEKVDKIVSFESAVQILKEKLSGFGVFHISEIMPLYMLKLTDKSEGPGKLIEARPAYTFLVMGESEDSPLGIIKTNNCQHYFYVDMITGELTSDLDLKSE